MHYPNVMEKMALFSHALLKSCSWNKACERNRLLSVADSVKTPKFTRAAWTFESEPSNKFSIILLIMKINY